MSAAAQDAAPSPELDLLSFGEAIIDFLPDARGRLRDVPSFHKAPGGAPSNVALAVSKLGLRSGLMGKVGADDFGLFLRDFLAKEGVDVTDLKTTTEAKTAIVFVSIDESGERSFMSFGGNQSAEKTYRADEIIPARLARAGIILMGSNLMPTQPAREATMRALRVCRELDRFVIMDPNVRAHLWEDHREITPTVEGAFSLVDLIKLSDEELAQLSPHLSPAQYYERVLKPRGVLALIATHAEGGAEVFCHNAYAKVQAPEVEVVDTTGAGDGFVAGFIAAICELTTPQARANRASLRQTIQQWSDEQWARVLDVGCFVGSHVCTTLGATTALPTREDIPWDNLLGPR